MFCVHTVVESIVSFHDARNGSPQLPGNEVILVQLRLILTHWGRVMHICVRNLTLIGSDNGLSPGRRQVITWTNVGILFIGPLGTHFSEMSIEIHTFSLKKIHLKMSSGKLRPCCLDLNVLTHLKILDFYMLNKMASNLQQLFPNAISSMKSLMLWVKFHLILFLRV